MALSAAATSHATHDGMSVAILPLPVRRAREMRAPATLIDPQGRRFPYLRLSVIEACNFRCGYCLPSGYAHGPGRASALSISEIRRLLTGFAGLCVHKVRITGGEPSLRRDLADIIATTAAVPGIRKVALTSNGLLLRRRIDAWADAGLTHLNVSVDALDRTRFAAITGRDALPDILDGVARALELGGLQVKLNAVLLRGLNDDQLDGFLRFVETRPVSVRFIELMQTGDNADYFRRHHLRADALEAAILARGWRPSPAEPGSAAGAGVDRDAGPAVEFAHPDYVGRIGIIAPYARDFCASCNRLRVTSTGDLRLCLFGNVGIPLRPLLQADDQLGELQDTLVNQLALKAESHALHRGETGMTRHLASIGG